MTSDYLPTVLDAIGIEYPDDRPLDGESLMGVLLGTARERVKPIGFQSAKQVAWHDGRYKLYSKNNGKSWELYDLNADIGETSDLAQEQGELVAKMAAQVKAWRESCQRSDGGKDY